MSRRPTIVDVESPFDQPLRSTAPYVVPSPYLNGYGVTPYPAFEPTYERKLHSPKLEPPPMSIHFHSACEPDKINGVITAVARWLNGAWTQAAIGYNEDEVQLPNTALCVGPELIPVPLPREIRTTEIEEMLALRGLPRAYVAQVNDENAGIVGTVFGAEEAIVDVYCVYARRPPLGFTPPVVPNGFVPAPYPELVPNGFVPAPYSGPLSGPPRMVTNGGPVGTMGTMGTMGAMGAMGAMDPRMGSMGVGMDPRMGSMGVGMDPRMGSMGVGMGSPMPPGSMPPQNMGSFVPGSLGPGMMPGLGMSNGMGMSTPMPGMPGMAPMTSGPLEMDMRGGR